MVGEFSDDIYTFTATAAVVHNRFIKQTTTVADAPGSFKGAPAGAGEIPFGISVDSAASGGKFGVAYGDIGLLEVDGSGTSIAAGDYLKPTTGGVGVKGTTADVVGAIALEPCTEANVAIKVRIITPQALTSPPSSIPRSYIDNETLVDNIPLSAFRTWDAPMTALPLGAGTNDDLGYTNGTLGTDAHSLESKDFKATTCTQYAIIERQVPATYVGGQALTLRINAGAKTTVSDGTLTVDANVYRQGAPTVDICATAATACNSLTAADKDFTLTPTGVVAGELLYIRIAVIGGDTATATAVIGKINSVKLLAVRKA